MTKDRALKRETREPIQSASSLQSDASTEIIEPDGFLEDMIQEWLRRATFLSDVLRSLTSPRKNETILSIQEWIREEKETGETALRTHLLRSILSPPKTKIKKRNFQDSEQAKGEYIITADDTTLDKRATVKFPEEKVSYVRGEYLITKDNTPLDEIATAMNNASSFMQEARLVVRSRHIPIEDINAPYTILRLPKQTPHFKDIFGVVQDTEHTEFMLKANIYFDTHMEPFGFCCEIIYNPVSEDCLLYNGSGLSIRLTGPGEQEEIYPGRGKNIRSGPWRISVTPNRPLFEILVLPKRFSANKWIPTVQGSNLFPRESQEIQYNPPDLSKANTSIFDVTDGETVYIQGLPADTYDLQRIKVISTTSKTSVFSCQYSKTRVVAKVYCVNNDKQNLHSIKDGWKREKSLLDRLHHPNIISLEGSDSRFHALYLRPVFPSLDKIEDFNSSEIETILHNMSSALAYLSKEKIVHYDIKPANIIYSSSQGAVLIDFDLAKSAEFSYEGAGGTPGYLPPEMIEPGKERGPPGDIWALGVTALWMLKMIYHPNLVIIIAELKRPGSLSFKNMKKWLRSINSKRNELNLDDEVQGLVYEMLEPESEARVTASALERRLKGDPIAKKQKHN